MQNQHGVTIGIRILDLTTANRRSSTTLILDVERHIKKIVFAYGV